MTLTKAFCCAVFAAGVVAAAPTPAASAGSLYDMDRMLSEPHPLAGQYGTRWRPAVRPSAPAVAPVPVASPTAPRRPPQTRITTQVQPAKAASPKKQSGFISEIKIGVLAHDQGPFSSNKEDGIDGQVELRFVSPDFLKVIGSPNPHIGADISASGNTSSVWLGVVWEREVWKKLFVGWSMGGAYHNGETNQGTAEPDEKELGCRVLFRLGFNIGWRFNDRQSIDLLLDHISNAKLCDTNEGLENVGIRYGYRF